MKEPPWFGRLFFLRDAIPKYRGTLRAEVFNTFVENAVENGRSTFLSDSPRDASTLCTEASAGTFVVQLASIEKF
jgi:hypothetical protein